jgi:lysozyme family protein
MYDPFSAALAFTLKHEGGLVNDPNDPGGLTNFGISQRQYPDEDIRNLSRKRVEQIYRDDYWNAINGDKLPPELAFVLFDYAVNCGVPRAVRDLQLIVNTPRDGIVGPKTLHALSFYSVPYIVEQVLQARCRFYLRLCSRGVRYHTFLAGWLKRLISCAAKWNIQVD